ncbi:MULTISPECIES: hypothetical protein [Streptacidiphilus]|uniref:Uncharacterized protein n=2 Tax=Streptacidiphilus TaxID=228398 RepID=A0ABV6UL80_9ACTN|nr:hypothetical protein [Streptacidiphilus jeojiense]
MGQNINNQGDVWYHVVEEWDPATDWVNWDDYVYGAYVDNYAVWHAHNSPGGFPQC